jgi:phage-related protein
MKELKWVGGTSKRLKAFPVAARRKAGYELGQVQLGEEPSDWKPMVTVGPGAVEIRIHEPHEHRVIYVARFADAVYVLNAFEKKTQQTPAKEIRLARAAYAEVQRQHKQNK